jgi:serine/threonine protein kinase
VLEKEPDWWTPTTKSIVLAGTVFGMLEAHNLKIIHRGVKSANVLLDELHRPRLCDFGTGKQSPRYAAPEVGDDDRGGSRLTSTLSH